MSPVRRILSAARLRRARRALERQLDYQRAKARALQNIQSTEEFIAANTARLRAKLVAARPLAADDRVLEVGSGPHGHVFFLGHNGAVGVDPLAAHYRTLYPRWQSRAATVAARGERLPFTDASFDVVISDNVVDHAENPAAIVHEMVRVLAPGGLLYFSVNVHHPAYRLMSGLQLTAFVLRLPVEVAAFSDHTVHFTPNEAARLFDGLPLDVLSAHTDLEGALAVARATPSRHIGDRLKRVLFKNATYDIIALRRSSSA